MATRIIPIEDIEKQNYYMQAVRDMNLGKAEQPIACIKTFGCQMNEHDSEKISGMVERMGYRIVPDEIEGKYEDRICDLVVFNTCCTQIPMAKETTIIRMEKLRIRMMVPVDITSHPP